MNLETYRGDTSTYLITITDAVTRDPIDLTGWTIYLTIKRKINDPDSDAVVKNTYTLFLAPLLGQTLLSISSSQSNNLLGTYFYDVRAVTSTGSVQTLLSGEIIFKKDVTRTHV